MNLLLTSGGISTVKLQDELAKLIKKPFAHTRIAFIPIGAEAQEDQSFVEKSREQIRALGVASLDDIDLKTTQHEALEKTLAEYDIIWVNGGNTFYLLYWVRQSGFDKIIAKLLNKGIVYVGVSAGTFLASPTIDVANWKGYDDASIVSALYGDNTLDSFTALHLVDFYTFVHNSPQWNTLIKEKEKLLNTILIRLHDTDGIAVTDEGYRVIRED